MRQLTLIFFLLLTINLSAQKDSETPTIAKKTESLQAYEGFFKYYWDEKGGKIWLEVENWDSEFLYINSLSAGIGSNDIGLDRNQLGNDRVVKFTRSGPKVLMVQPNYKFRAVSEMAAERESVAEAFASSVIWGFKVEAETDGKVLIDITPLLLSDAHGVADRLKRNKQGTFKIDASRSAIYLERTKNFPKNSEFEAITTFTGDASGGYIRSVTPTADAVTVRQHHSFVELPDDNYQPRIFDPRSGFIPTSYYDYATPIDQPLVKRFILRHRLEKKNPNTAVSEAVEPIVYYLDNGTPEPIRSALLEGARWWNQAYEAAGYKDAFQVKVLPDGADPMDVRYNMINWVHRSTRGWSYGSSVVDPRTGEIIKGHVLLGSLRVRQDFLIAQGLVEAYADGAEADPRLLEMALARLRQLSAHEVGHTIGLTHNFAASYNDRASVMDYPHPYIALDDKGEIDFSQAYDVGIGDWDKRMIIYGYSDFPDGTDEPAKLQEILAENIRLGLKFISDRDARPAGGAHPVAHLWDNGSSAVAELERLTAVRKKALSKFSEKNIAPGAPMATLENVLVPLYLAHRYQVEGVSKVIGGVNYTYAVRGDGQPTNEMVADAEQRKALNALLATLDPEFLAIPQSVIDLIPPQPMGYSRDRELFKIHTGLTFDPLAAAESSIEHTLNFLLEPQRLARVVEHHARDAQRMSLHDLLNELTQSTISQTANSAMAMEIKRIVQKSTLNHLLQLAGDKSIMQQVSAAALYKITELEADMKGFMDQRSDAASKAHVTYLLQQISRFKDAPDEFKVPEAPSLPDGSPIGCGE
ncbi:zinc-dependent metalloprotease [Flavilitoribacter nigricans]|uniref:Peptidase n=1 Tax=Flavilitoribacter nigricans (strain ATCC 23147 / DSM 23189 / NBRC 102662 / NCIMB 1420 / SS-2) TaxID=1122177 RepID=A0A2D0N500_FLAN2|nr:zinc-dependent metalloprotease [Flavilitoribacter nigricans]PHN02853.1 peptidase [Flavilitoribacter nigricans DSM 23189 = NBRC 102662]